MKTVREVMAGQERLRILTLRGVCPNYLDLLRRGRRIDLVDADCRDTGMDYSEWTLRQLGADANCWLSRIGCGPGDVAQAIPGLWCDEHARWMRGRDN